MVVQEYGKAMGKSMRRVEFLDWWFMFREKPYVCHCGKSYGKRGAEGWMRRHGRVTGHWKGLQADKIAEDTTTATRDEYGPWPFKFDEKSTTTVSADKTPLLIEWKDHGGTPTFHGTTFEAIPLPRQCTHCLAWTSQWHEHERE